MDDPVADKTDFLKMYMSNHPDTLVAYAKWFGKVQETIDSAEMSVIDSRSMTLTCTLKGGERKVVRVPLEPPLSGYEEVKPRLLEMKAEAQEGLGMIQAPQLKSFHLPFDAIYSAMLVLALVYFTLHLQYPTDPVFSLAGMILPHIGGQLSVWIAWATVVITHVLEAVYTFSLCKNHRTGFFVGAGYVIATLLFGFPIWSNMRKRIQAMRIDSVMKVQ